MKCLETKYCIREDQVIGVDGKIEISYVPLYKSRWESWVERLLGRIFKKDFSFWDSSWHYFDMSDYGNGYGYEGIKYAFDTKEEAEKFIESTRVFVDTSYKDYTP